MQAWGRVVTRLATLFVLLFFAGCGVKERETNVDRYERCKRYFPKSDVAHFPKRIPTDACSPVFCFQQRVLQGSAILQLRVTLPAAKIESLASELEDAALHQYEGGGPKFEHLNADRENNVPTTSYRTPTEAGVTSDEYYGFPKHFTMYVLSATTNGGWNHGKTKGIALSRESNEAIYWTESW